MMYFLTRVLGVLWIVSLSMPIAWASKTADSSNNKWSFMVEPYVWGAGLKGTASTLPPLPSVDFDASFKDIVKHFDLGFMGVAELRKGRFGIFTDIVWFKISADSSGPLPPPFTRALDLESNTFMGTLAGAYRLAEKEQSWIDLVLGVRGWYVSTDLDVGPGILLGARKIADDEGWVDAIGGLRTRLQLSKGFYARAAALVGGGSSESVVDVTGQLGYAFTKMFSVSAGYRYMTVNYRQSGFEWDMENKGPILGGQFRF